MHVLDNPVWHALVGPQRAFGRATDLAARFDEDVARFGALANGPDSDTAWQDLGQLLGPKGTVELMGDLSDPPPGWTVIDRLEGVQMVGDGVETVHAGADARPGPRVPPATRAVSASLLADTLASTLVPLRTANVPEMLALVKAAQPGPFERRTVELGSYLGVRIEGHLVAMAGERIRPPGYAEISAVATHPDYRRLGLARQVVRGVADNIIRRGDTPCLHVLARNTGAIHLYESLGFTIRRRLTFLCLEAPG